jgi:hypothetical protein
MVDSSLIDRAVHCLFPPKVLDYKCCFNFSNALVDQFQIQMKFDQMLSVQHLNTLVIVEIAIRHCNQRNMTNQTSLAGNFDKLSTNNNCQ